MRVSESALGSTGTCVSCGKRVKIGKRNTRPHAQEEQAPLPTPTQAEEPTIDTSENAVGALSGERILSKEALQTGSAVGVLFVVWGLVARLLPFSTFHKAAFSLEYTTPFLIFGFWTGIVAYHIWKSERRANIIIWMRVMGVVGAFLGCFIAPPTPRPGDLYLTFVRIILGAILGAIVFASMAAVCASSKRRVLLKALVVPAAFAWPPLLLFLTFVHLTMKPLAALEWVSQAGGYVTGLALIPALVVVGVRYLRRRRAARAGQTGVDTS